ncbi:Zinc finger protein isoform 2 [Schistosoma japonicum]|uniref:Zinc finger protein isoform 2 n=1 Tax=Schistosoma japonicum TaxID=6182 RepID=A0A4Z2D303_SCHJA|nr:Zinc finger protein isoform 2 [Schistosoma japonicum]
MMDVSGTDPRTRTGLFLWPWASYPAVAANAAVGAHAQPIMMGASAGAMSAVPGSNMLGVSYTGSGPATIPGMIEDPFESFCQRFSYSGAHAAHMSHILPHQHVGLSDSRHLTQDHETGDNNNTNDSSRHPSHSPSINHARAHITSQRLLSAQPRSNANHLHQHTNATIGINDQLNDACNNSNNPTAGSNSHAAAIAAFASVAASSAIIGANDSTLGNPNGLSLSSHGIQVPRHVQTSLRNSGTNEMVLDGLCNGFAKPNQFSTQLHSSVTNALNRQQSVMNPVNCNKLQADTITPYNLHCHHLKGLGNPAAVALAAAVVGGGSTGDHSQFPAALNNELRDNSTPASNKHLDEQNPTGTNNSNNARRSHSNNDNFSLSHGQQQQFMFSPKSPLSDSMENPNTSKSTRGGNDLVNKSNNRLLSGPQQDRINNLIFRNSTLRAAECSPESTTAAGTGAVDRRSADLLIDDTLTGQREDNNTTNNTTTTSNNNNNNSNSVRVESRFLGINQEESLSINGLCNGEGSLSSILSVPNNHTSYHPPAKGYKCKICQHVCFSRHDLSAHNAATHKQDPRPYRCEQCGRQFSTCAYLSQHRRIHTGVKPYACRYCDRRFTQLSHVQQHERIHTGEKPYRCATCMKSFTQMSNLQSHQRQHMKGKPYRCEQCFMSFDTKEELDVHVQAKHSGNRYAKVSKKVLVCPICTKNYNSETYLAKHVDRHKEAAATAGVDGNGSNNNSSNNNSNRNNSSSNNNNNNNNMRNQTCVDNLFAAGFHNHSVAMAAAAASALSRGNVIESGSHIITGGSRHSHVNSAVGVGGGLHSSHSSHPGASAASAAAAAAVAAAHAHQDLHLRAVAAAAVASSNGIGVGNRTDIDSQCAFFNAATCSTETRVTSPNGCDLLHNNNALNYSSMSSGTGLFHHLPVGEGGVHASSAEHLATSVVQQQQQQQQQQCITPHRHQQGTHFTDDSQHLNAFNHSNISPNHHSQSQQQQQYNHHHQQHQHHQQPQHIQRNVHSSSSKRHSTMKSSPPQSTHRYSESPVTNDSQNQQQQQQHLLNLTQHHLTNPKRLCSPSSVESPKLDRYISTPTTSTTAPTTTATNGNNNIQQQHSHMHSLHKTHSIGGSISNGNGNSSSSSDSIHLQHPLSNEHMPQLPPPPAHQHCLQSNQTNHLTGSESSNPQHHHQQQPHHQNQRVGLSSQTHPNQAFLHNHINNFSSAPTSPDMMMSSNGLSTAPSLSDNNSSLSTFEGFRQTIKPTSEDCPKWHSDGRSDIIDAVVTTDYCIGSNEAECAIEDNRESIISENNNDHADVPTKNNHTDDENSHHDNDNNTNTKNDMNTSSQMYDFLFHGNSIIGDDDDDDDDNISSSNNNNNNDNNNNNSEQNLTINKSNRYHVGSVGDGDEGENQSEGTDDIFHYENNVGKDNKSLFGNTNGSLFNRDQVCRSSVSPASLSPKSGQGIAAVEAITTRSCNGSIHNGTPLSSSSSPVNNPIIIDNNGNSMNLKQGQYTHQLTSSNNNTEFNGSILNDRRQSTDLRIGTNDKYMSDKLKPIDMKHLFLSNDHVSDNNNHSNLNNDTNTATTSENLELNNNNTDVYPSTTSLTNRSLKHSLTNDHHSMKNMIENNHEADDDELLTKSHFHHHKRQVIMSDSNNEKNTVSPTECNIDDADTSDGDHVESNYLVNNKIDHRNNNDETIDIDNDPQTSNETPFYLGQKTQQEQQNHPNEQHQMNSSTTSSSPSSLSSTVAEKHYSDTLNSSKRRRRHQYVPQHLPVFDFNTKDMSDRGKNNSTVNNNNMYSTTTDYCINRRSKNNVAILENGENKCLKSGRIVGKSDSLDDEIISSDNFDKNENNNNNPTMNDNNSRECYFSAF